MAIDKTLEVTDIMEILPHRYPMLLVDRIIELEPMKYAIGIKNATFDELFFQGHFPGKPVMPSVLLAEAMAQVGRRRTALSEENRGLVPFLYDVDVVRFRHPVRPVTRSSCAPISTSVKGHYTGAGKKPSLMGDTLCFEERISLCPHARTGAKIKISPI